MSELLTHSILFGVATLISRLLGLVRDAAFAHYFGRSEAFDAYTIAIMLPFFLRRIFAEGALSSAFIPLFSRKEKKDSQKFLSTTIWLLLLSTSIIYIFVLFFSKNIAFLLGSGLSKDTLNLSANLMKIAYPFIIFISLWAIISGVLNTKKIFFTPAVAPALTNITTILGIFFSFLFLPKILGPVIGFTIGGLLQFLFVIPALKKIGYSITFDFEKKYVKEISVLFGPALLGVAVTTLNTLVDQNIATWTGTGGVSTIQYASRLYQLPLGLFAVSVANSLLPKLSQAVHLKNEKIYSKHLKDSIEIILFLTIPSAVGLFLLSNGLIGLIYQHGNFTQADTLITGKTLAMYAIGLPFYSLYSIFVRTYHSKLNTKLPTIISIIMLIVNALLNLIFIFYIKTGIYGIALATSLSGILGMVISMLPSIKHINLSTTLEIIKIIIASSLMGIFILLTQSLFNSKVLLLIQILISIFIYFGFAYLLKIKNMNQVINIFFKKVSTFK